MKLEAGKKYITRDGQIAECLAVWTRQLKGFQASVVIGHSQIPVEYTIDGRFNPKTTDGEHLNIISEYTEPKKVADYAVPVFLESKWSPFSASDWREYKIIKTYEIGKQPECALKIEGTERYEQ